MGGVISGSLNEFSQFGTLCANIPIVDYHSHMKI